LQHQASLNAQIAMLQGKLHVTVAMAESRAAVMAEHDASIAFIMMELEKALEDETATSIALAQARTTFTGTV
jgi:hypothetical protein